MSREDRPEALDFLERLWALAHALETASREMERTIGVTGPQRFLLRMVGRYPGISAGELASRLHLHPSTLTLLLAKLESRRLIRRVADPQDGRRALFALTPAGREIDRRTAGTIEGRVAAVLRDLDPERVAVAQEVIAALADGLGDPETARRQEGRAVTSPDTRSREPSAASRSRGGAAPRARARRG